jgi:four helix bundle protein
MRDYRKIRAWQRADDLAVEIYQETKHFPKEEIYGLTSQMRRAAVSVAANIVEGSSRATRKDYLHFLNIAHASLNETQYFLHLSQRIQILTPVQYERLQQRASHCFRSLSGLIQAVRTDGTAACGGALRR